MVAKTSRVRISTIVHSGTSARSTESQRLHRYPGADYRVACVFASQRAKSASGRMLHSRGATPPPRAVRRRRMPGIVESPVGQSAQSGWPRQGNWMQSRASSVRFGRAAARTQGGSPHLTYRRTLRRRASRFWGRLSWPVSISLFAVPVALALVTFSMPEIAASPEVAVRVTDRYTGQQIPGATIIVIGEMSLTDRMPTAPSTIELQNDSSPVTIQAPGYEAITTTLSREGSPTGRSRFDPLYLRGRLIDAETLGRDCRSRTSP